MTARNITPPYPVFLDRDGTPLDNGFVFIGVENLEPVTNPLPVYWDEALTIPAAQPIRTINGYPSRAGTPSALYSDADFSITVRDSKGLVVYTAMSVQSASDILSSNLALPSGSSLVGFVQSGPGAVPATVQAKAREIVSVKDFGAKGDGVWFGVPGATASTVSGTDDTDAFTAAIASGHKKIRLPEGTYVVSGGFLIPSYLEFEGDGMERTFIYQKSNSNLVMFTNLGGAVSGNIGVKFSDLTIHGNQYRDVAHPPENPTGNITHQCFNWNTGTGANIPSLTLRNVKITSFYGDNAFFTANYIYGSVWVEFTNVYIMNNMYPSALLLKTSDNIIHGLYAAGNGGWGALPGIRIQGGADSRFIGCYFGGGGCVHQVQVEGSIYNQFIGCTNDNTYGANYRFIDANGAHADQNIVIGGSATNADQSNTGTWAHIQLEDASHNNQFIGVKIDNTLGNFAKYGVAEKAGSTCSNNLVSGCWFAAPAKFITSQALLRSGGLSRIVDSPGYRGVGFTGASASTATAQALTNGSQTIVNFGTVEYDQDGAITTGAAWKYTAPSAGVYEILGCVSFTGAASTVTILEVWKNNSVALRPTERSISMGTTYNENFATSILLSAGDYIDIRALIFNAGMTLRADAKFNWVRISRKSGS